MVVALHVSPEESAYLPSSTLRKIAYHIDISSASFLGLSRLLRTNYRRDSCNSVRRSHSHFYWWRDTKDLELDGTKTSSWTSAEHKRKEKKRKEQSMYRQLQTTPHSKSLQFTGGVMLICRNKKFNITIKTFSIRRFNPLKPELNPICYLLALLAHHFLHVSRIRVISLTLRLLMSYIYIWSTYSWCF